MVIGGLALLAAALGSLLCGGAGLLLVLWALPRRLSAALVMPAVLRSAERAVWESDAKWRPLPVRNPAGDRLEARRWSADPKQTRWLLMLKPNNAVAGRHVPGLAAARRFAQRLGRGLVQFNYRGIGSSEGRLRRPEDLVQDAEAVLTQLGAEDDVLLYGHSIGGAVAVGLQARRPGLKAIVDRSFSSLGAVVCAHASGWLGAVLGAGLALGGAPVISLVWADSPSCWLVALMAGALCSARLHHPVIRWVPGLLGWQMDSGALLLNDGSTLVLHHARDEIVPPEASLAVVASPRAAVQLGASSASAHNYTWMMSELYGPDELETVVQAVQKLQNSTLGQ